MLAVFVASAGAGAGGSSMGTEGAGTEGVGGFGGVVCSSSSGSSSRPTPTLDCFFFFLTCSIRTLENVFDGIYYTIFLPLWLELLWPV